jgi:hypothetical protein
MNSGVNCTVGEQCRLLETILRNNSGVYRVISNLDLFNLPNAYVSAGCITQTVWNFQDGKPISYGISDIDVIYYDKDDLTPETESKIEYELRAYFSDIGYKIDITNEARTHLWYESKFGIAIPAYISSEDAINSWIPATAIGVKYFNREFCVYAPFGLNDMYGQIVRPNKSLATREHFELKSAKWQSKWNNVRIIPWES